VWVKAEELTPNSILAALKAGHFYSSTGPMIHDVQVYPGERVVVRCSPADWVFVTGKGPASAAAEGHGVTAVEVSLKSFKSPYCRVTVRDAQGGRAWTNAIWLEG
jgi:hypothetical protein